MTDLLFAGDSPRERAGGSTTKTIFPLSHYVSDAPFDPYALERMTPAQERFYMASEWRMVFRLVTRPRYRK